MQKLEFANFTYWTSFLLEIYAVYAA